MAITYPRDLPTIPRFTAVNFELDRVDFMAKEGSGRLAGLQAGWPLWRLDLEWGPGLTEAQSELFAAWISAQRGPARQFYGFNPKRRNPLSYCGGVAGLARATSGTLDANGDASSFTLNGDRDVVTLAGMPTGYRLRPGDFIGFRWSSGTKFTVSRCLEDVSAVAVTGALAMTVEPPVHSAVPASGAGAVAYTANTKVIMRLDPAQTRVSPMNNVRVRSGRLSALQEFVP